MVYIFLIFGNKKNGLKYPFRGIRQPRLQNKKARNASVYSFLVIIESVEFSEQEYSNRCFFDKVCCVKKLRDIHHSFLIVLLFNFTKIRKKRRNTKYFLKIKPQRKMPNPAMELSVFEAVAAIEADEIAK